MPRIYPKEKFVPFLNGFLFDKAFFFGRARSGSNRKRFPLLISPTFIHTDWWKTLRNGVKTIKKQVIF